jgi:anti-sigma regulatory factor (Ser/Thr protein kinase)
VGRRGRGGGAAQPSLRISLPSDNSLLALVRDLAKRMAEGAGFDEATAGTLALAVDEAMANVIEHAYHGETGREIELRFEDRGPDFTVELMDSGDRIDPGSLPHFELARYVNERRTGGLGVHLMGRIMDSVSFRRIARRNVCCLVKHKIRVEARRP